MTKLYLPMNDPTPICSKYVQGPMSINTKGLLEASYKKNINKLSPKPQVGEKNLFKRIQVIKGFQRILNSTPEIEELHENN